MIDLSVVVPAFNEEANLAVLYERLASALDGLGLEWELIIVDDCSRDATFAVIGTLAGRDARVRGVRFARNAGSHTAILCGLERARGTHAAVLAADMQDPPAVIAEMLAKARAGAQIVWAVRAARIGENARTLFFARLYYFIMRRFVGLADVPANGADFFLITRPVIDALAQFPERNVSLFMLLTWMGYRQDSVTYTKQPRHAGTSGWTLEKRIKLAVDSILAFSYRPIRLMFRMGVLACAAAIVGAGIIGGRAIAGASGDGWAIVLVAVTFLAGVQMCMLGTLGEYVYRGYDEARGRPRFLIEREVGAGVVAPR